MKRKERDLIENLKPLYQQKKIQKKQSEKVKAWQGDVCYNWLASGRIQKETYTKMYTPF